DARHGRHSPARHASTRQYRTREHHRLGERRRQNEQWNGQETEWRPPRDHLLDRDSHCSPHHHDGVDEAHREQQSQRHEEPAAPAVGAPRPHHHEKQRNHENRSRYAGDLRRPIGLPEMPKHEHRPECDRQAQQNGSANGSCLYLLRPEHPSLSSHIPFSRTAWSIPDSRNRARSAPSPSVRPWSRLRCALRIRGPQKAQTRSKFQQRTPQRKEAPPPHSPTQPPAHRRPQTEGTGSSPSESPVPPDRPRCVSSLPQSSPVLNPNTRARNRARPNMRTKAARKRATRGPRQTEACAALAEAIPARQAPTPRRQTPGIPESALPEKWRYSGYS